MPVFPAFRKRQKDCHKFKTSLMYRVKPSLNKYTNKQVNKKLKHIIQTHTGESINSLDGSNGADNLVYSNLGF